MLETKEYERSKEKNRLTACPCGYQFDRDEPRPKHFLEDHEPDDFNGLSPLGDTSAADDSHLFEVPESIGRVRIDCTDAEMPDWHWRNRDDTDADPVEDGAGEDDAADIETDAEPTDDEPGRERPPHLADGPLSPH